VHPESRAVAVQAFEDVVARPGAQIRAEVPILNDDGLERWLDVRVSNLLDDPDVGFVLVNLHDVTDRHVAEEQLRHQAYHDPVTGAANRAALTDRITAATPRPGEAAGTSALVLLDLDDFSGVNERLGHDGGDLLLRQVHQRLLAVVRAGDTVARLGGDQFAILIAQAHEGPDEALAMANRVISRLSEPYQISGVSVVVGTSIGVAVADAYPADPDALLRDAAVALSRAKATGRGHVTLFEPSMREAAIDRLRLEADLLVALEREELTLHYQPIVDMATGRIAGAEALIRWIHPDLGMVPPDRFIGLAEQNGLIVPIGEWVVRTACAAAAEWRRALGLALEVSVNVSARQLVSDALVPTIGRAVADSSLEPSQLTVEITESAVVTDPELAARRLAEIRVIGVRVAIDDFGTGYSSLSYLQQLPVDVLKIDRSFVRGITADAPPPPIIRGLVDLATTLGLETVAEGVEEAHQLEFLRSVGCTYGQGYHFARPTPEPELLGVLGRATRNEPSDPHGSLM
jgi:diguanylate cyclase (GGDEF)-like protein